MLVGALGLAGSTIISSGPRIADAPVGGQSDDTNDRLINVVQRQWRTPAPLLDRGRRAVTLPL